MRLLTRHLRRCLAAGSALCLVALGAAACSGSSDNGITTITLSGDSSPASIAAQDKVIKLFEASHPHIRVKLEPAPGANAEEGSILRLGQGDTSLDVVTTEVGYEYQWYKDGWITPLTRYFSKRELATVDDHLIDNETYDGQFLAIPLDNSTMWLSVNQDLLAKVGIKGPPTLKRDGFSSTVKGVWTWEQVLAAARKVKEKTGKTGLLFPNDEMWILSPMGQQLGGKTSSPDGLRVHGYLDQKPWVKLATKWRDFFTDNVSEITNPEWTNDQFLAGGAAFQLAHIGSFDMCTMAKFRCDAAAEPHFAGGKKMVQSNGIAWALNSASKHKAAAAEFLKFTLLNRSAEQALVTGDYFAAMPWLKTDLHTLDTSPAYRKFPLSVKRLGAYQFQNWPSKSVKTPAGVTMFVAMSDAFKDVRVGAETPAQAVKTMTDRVDRDLRYYYRH